MRAAVLSVLVLVVGVACLTNCSSLLGFAFRESRGWEFVQAVGGLALGTPYHTESGDVRLPIDCDVGGREITVKPTIGNSGLDCDKPDVEVREREILITVQTTLAQARQGLSCRCPDADLGALAAGHYTVTYLSPNGDEQPLGSIEVPD